MQKSLAELPRSGAAAPQAMRPGPPARCKRCSGAPTGGACCSLCAARAAMRVSGSGSMLHVRHLCVVASLGGGSWGVLCRRRENSLATLALPHAVAAPPPPVPRRWPAAAKLLRCPLSLAAMVALAKRPHYRWVVWDAPKEGQLSEGKLPCSGTPEAAAAPGAGCSGTLTHCRPFNPTLEFFDRWVGPLWDRVAIPGLLACIQTACTDRRAVRVPSVCSQRRAYPPPPHPHTHHHHHHRHPPHTPHPHPPHPHPPPHPPPAPPGTFSSSTSTAAACGSGTQPARHSALPRAASPQVRAAQRATDAAALPAASAAATAAAAAAVAACCRWTPHRQTSVVLRCCSMLRRVGRWHKHAARRAPRHAVEPPARSHTMRSPANPHAYPSSLPAGQAPGEHWTVNVHVQAVPRPGEAASGSALPAGLEALPLAQRQAPPPACLAPGNFAAWSWQ